MWLYVLVGEKRDSSHKDLCQFTEDLGCDYFKVFKVGSNATYTSPEIVAEFLDIMAVNVKVKSITKCESFTLMCDESRPGLPFTCSSPPVIDSIPT